MCTVSQSQYHRLSHTAALLRHLLHYLRPTLCCVVHPNALPLRSPALPLSATPCLCDRCMHWLGQPLQCLASSFTVQCLLTVSYRFGFCSYGQLPRYEDGCGIDLVQSLIILRHIARVHGLYGNGHTEAAHIDSVIDGLEDLRTKTKVLVYTEHFGDSALEGIAILRLNCIEARCAAHQDEVLAPLTTSTTGATVMATFERIVQHRVSTQHLWFVQSGLSIADIALMNMVDIHLPLFPQVITHKKS